MNQLTEKQDRVYMQLMLKYKEHYKIVKHEDGIYCIPLRIGIKGFCHIKPYSVDGSILYAHVEFDSVRQGSLFTRKIRDKAQDSILSDIGGIYRFPASKLTEFEPILKPYKKKKYSGITLKRMRERCREMNEKRRRQ